MKLVDSAGVAALLTAYLYCVSTAFTHGYFYTLGLDSDLLDRNFHQIIYSGLIQSLNSLVGFASVVLILVTIYSTWRVAISYNVRKGYKTARKIVRFKKRFRIPTKKPTKLEARYQLHFNAAVGLFLATLGFVVLLLIHENEGVKRATSVIESIQNKTKTTFKAENYENELVFLYCGVRNCAGYDPKVDRVVYVPQQQLSLQNKKI
ncbi:hypothetical protein ACONRW_004696 [Vibrio parahaemolyticus]|nr:hypothetical protein [Vibrio parahaemolyticus]